MNKHEQPWAIRKRKKGCLLTAKCAGTFNAVCISNSSHIFPITRQDLKVLQALQQQHLFFNSSISRGCRAGWERVTNFSVNWMIHLGTGAWRALKWFAMIRATWALTWITWHKSGRNLELGTRKARWGCSMMTSTLHIQIVMKTGAMNSIRRHYSAVPWQQVVAVKIARAQSQRSTRDGTWCKVDTSKALPLRARTEHSPTNPETDTFASVLVPLLKVESVGVLYVSLSQRQPRHRLEDAVGQLIVREDHVAWAVTSAV